MSDYFADLLSKTIVMRPWAEVNFSSMGDVWLDMAPNKPRFISSIQHTMFSQQGTSQVVMELQDDSGGLLERIIESFPVGGNRSNTGLRIRLRYGWWTTEGPYSWSSGLIQLVGTDLQVSTEGSGMVYSATAIDAMTALGEGGISKRVIEAEGIVSALQQLFASEGPNDPAIPVVAIGVKDDGVRRKFEVSGRSKTTTARSWIADYVGDTGRKVTITSGYEGDRDIIYVHEEPEKPTSEGNPSSFPLVVGWPQDGMRVFSTLPKDPSPVIQFSPSFSAPATTILNYVSVTPDPMGRTFVASGSPPAGSSLGHRIYSDDDPVSLNAGATGVSISRAAPSPDDAMSTLDNATQANRHHNEVIKPSIMTAGIEAEIVMIGMPGKPSPGASWCDPKTFIEGAKRWINLRVEGPFSLEAGGGQKWVQLYGSGVSKALSGTWYVQSVTHTLDTDGYTTSFGIQKLPTMGTEFADDLRLIP